MDKEPVKGMYKPYGFYINRPFYLQSAMYMGRYLCTSNGTDLRIESKRAGFTDVNARRQQFMFNMKTKTVINVYHKDRSIEIHNAGRNV